jgi:DNA-directed RNA polymerase specialized sigma24 family protein
LLAVPGSARCCVPTGTVPTDLPDLDRLLAQQRWLADLARRLVRDVHLADDLAQGTLAAAVAAPGGTPARVRGYLATILRNLLRQHRRKEGQRADREARAARSLALPSTAATVVRVESERRLAAAVLALDEPFRSSKVVRQNRFHAISCVHRHAGLHQSRAGRNEQRRYRHP